MSFFDFATSIENATEPKMIHFSSVKNTNQPGERTTFEKRSVIFSKIQPLDIYVYVYYTFF